MRKYNFYPGPSTIPASILERYREEILEYGDAGASFIELSHRSKEVLACHGRILAALRRMLGAAEEEYHVLLLPGGAIGQYAAVPMNLAGPNDPVAVAITGHWSRIAMREMARYCKAEVAVDTSPDCRALPPVADWNIPAESKFLAIVDNETIHGVEFPALPDAGGVPLVVDQSSNILSRPLDMKPVGALFACLQKNLGPTGLAVVVVRKDLCAAPPADLPVPPARDDPRVDRRPGRRRQARRAQPGKKRAAVLLHRRRGFLLEQRRPRLPLAHERPVPARGRESGRRLRRRRARRRHPRHQGPPRGRRHAGLDLQRDAEGRRRGADRVHEGLRRAAGLGADAMAEAERPALLLVDGTNYLFRAFHALGERIRGGQPTNAVYGLANSLIKLREDHPGAALACAMDARGKTFRHEFYPEYKGTRKETDPDLIAQIEPAKDVVRALGAALYCVAGVEADDVIATLARQGLDAGVDVYVASSDKDLKYLVAAGCRIIDPKDGSIEDARRIKERYGVPPELMNDYLALCGDAADNIPGIPKVGAKTAAKWLLEYKDLAGVVANRDAIKGKVGENLRANLDKLELSRRLVQLKADPALVEEICQRFSFNPQIKARMLRSKAPAGAAVKAVAAERLAAAADFAQAARLLQGAARLGVAAALTPGDACGKKIASLAIYMEDRALYVALAPIEEEKDQAADRKAALAFLTKLLANEKLEICAFGAKEILHALANDGVAAAAKIHDV
ncbi:MAG: aminotransferase class V-fold PLP-dependent enzyme, partial [Betaproteobacteria bacterium AqS2]|nr:aminotransferase class V-fold PLP-dependent enzyme [Betaproteobacteria bacterium AqS2]